MENERDLYQILQIDPAAEQEIVQAAFKRLALKHHPDRNQALDAHQRMQELNDAYALISDPAQRAAYDRERQKRLNAQRQAEEEARYQEEAARRAEAARLRREQEAARRRAENERLEKVRAAAAQRRVEYQEQIRAQQAAMRQAKRERQQREWEARQAARVATGQAAAEQAAVQAAPSIETSVEFVKEPDAALEAAPEAAPEAVLQARVWDEPEQSPIDLPIHSDCERRKLALQQSRRALIEHIFKLDFAITEAAEQLNYWSSRRVPWQIDVQAGQDTAFIIGSAVTMVTLLLAGFMVTHGSATVWAAAFGLVGIGAGWWTWRTSLSILPVRYMADAWRDIKRARELQRQALAEELAQLEVVIQVSSDY